MYTYSEKGADENDHTKDRVPHVMRAVGPFPVQFEENGKECNPCQNRHGDHNRWEDLDEFVRSFA